MSFESKVKAKHLILQKCEYLHLLDTSNKEHISFSSEFVIYWLNTTAENNNI